MSTNEILEFNGKEQYIVKDLFSAAQNSFTYEFWIKPAGNIKIIPETISGTFGINGQRWVIGAGHGGMNGKNSGAGISVGLNGITVLEHSNNYLTATLVYQFKINKFTHIAIVYNDKTPSLYINGNFIKTGLRSPKQHVYPSGIFGGLEPYGNFIGQVGNLRIWNHARTEKQIKHHLISQIARNEPGLLCSTAKILEKKNSFYRFPKKEIHLINKQIDQMRIEKIDIIICVYNALDHVKKCIESIKENTIIPHRLILIDDGSNSETKKYLQSLDGIILIKNKENIGYTKSVNIGLKSSSSRNVVILNSDTIVSMGWLNKLIDALDSEEKIGIVSPLSNAASYQSVPRIFKPGTTEWDIHEPPFNVQLWSQFVKQTSGRKRPYLPNLNGFCLAIKRKVINKIGYFDEKKFPLGYGEENEYCLRAQDNGFDTRIVDNCYIYHAKSKSFTHERRKELSNKSNKVYTEIFNIERLRKNNKILQEYNPLNAHRYRIQHFKSISLTIGYVLPVAGISGGIISVLQLVKGLNDIGIKASVIIPNSQLKFIHKINEMKKYIITFNKTEEIPKIGASFDILVATHNSSVKFVQEAIKLATKPVLPGYFIQDYEPWFYEPHSHECKVAKDSYEIIPDIVGVAKTDYLVETVRELHPDFNIYKIPPSFDLSMYKPHISNLLEKVPIKICAMVRPSTPRRAPQKTIKVLTRLLNEVNSKVEIHIFGCENRELKNLNVNRSIIKHGVLDQPSVFNLMCNCDIFLDMSTFQAFGRTGLEAMAAGCLPILPKDCGTSEYAINDQNALLIDTKNEESALRTLLEIINNSSKRLELKKNALNTVLDYDCIGDALRQWEVFCQEYKFRFKPPKVSIIIFVNKKDHYLKWLENLMKNTSYSHYELLIISTSVNYETIKNLNNKRIGNNNNNIKVIGVSNTALISKAYNEAAATAKGELLLFLNEGIEFENKNWLSKMVKQLLTIPLTSAVVPKILLPDKTVHSSGIKVNINEEKKSFLSAEEIKKSMPSSYVDAVSSNCLLIKKDIFNIVGGFDTKFNNRQMAIDLSFSLRANGFDLYFCSESSVTLASTSRSEEKIINSDKLRLKWDGLMNNLI
ncbi:glycosyltransferase [Metabacillus arenae]|uniref:Glycosyltransferase n=1 Tax=Metabacillus arenae TaxID=2771434 RepID=A0A926RVL5_9BACI|nr:glycosyltransferase [Metabacillus arenae]MBD1378991.1 glycosyltransferase [Metabacillus arenae]